MGLIPGVQQSDLGLFKEYNEVPGAYCRSTTKCPVLIKVLQQSARGWFQEYNKMPGADFKSTKKCPKLIQMTGVQQSARGWSQEYITMPDADPSRQVETQGILLYSWDQGVVTKVKTVSYWSEKDNQITTLTM